MDEFLFNVVLSCFLSFFLSWFVQVIVAISILVFVSKCSSFGVFEFILMWKSGKNKHGNDKVFTFKIWAPFFSIKEKEDKFIGGRVRR